MRKSPVVVMAVLYSRDPDYVLLIRNKREKEPWWKFIGESVESNETPVDTLVRALWEEGGFMVCNLNDPQMYIEEVRPAVTVFGKPPHTQYFFKVRLPYERLRDLSGKRFPGADPDEFFETKIFPIQELATMPDFFKRQHRLYKEFLGHTA